MEFRGEFTSFNKEEVLLYSNNSFWKKLRITSLILFILLWISLVITSIVFVIITPRCHVTAAFDWWQNGVFYQIYVRSFYDSDDDGIGDIRGITLNLDYLKSLGINAICLSSIFQSHNKDSNSSGIYQNNFDYGYEVIDYNQVDKSIGDISDIQQLIVQAHLKNMAVIIDFVPNHTGLDHPWFKESEASTNYSEPKWNAYIWADSKMAAKPFPNNWESVYGDLSSWASNIPTPSNERTHWYMHQFFLTQPDLNLRSDIIQKELEKILVYWMEEGIDGFRIVGTNYLYENSDFKDETCLSYKSDQTNCSENKRESTKYQRENYDLLFKWRSLLQTFQNNNSLLVQKTKIVISDGDHNLDETIKHYGSNYRNGVHLATNHLLTKFNKMTSGKDIGQMLMKWFNNLSNDVSSLWMTGDQDIQRLNSRYGNELSRVMLMLKMTLPGSTFLYYGEEIGMLDNIQTPTRDPLGTIDLELARDTFRSPLHWTNKTISGGFTNFTKPWLTIRNNQDPINVKAQINDESSQWKLVQNLISLKYKEKSLQKGKFELHYADEDIVAFTRKTNGSNRIQVVLNFGKNMTIDEERILSKGYDDTPTEATVLLMTKSDYKMNSELKINPRRVKRLARGEGYIAMWKYMR